MKKVKIGTIYNTLGLKGELKVHSYSNYNDDRFKVGNHLYLESKDGKVVEVEVKKYTKVSSDKITVIFKDYEDINLAEPLKTMDIYINREDMSDVEDGFYYFELIDCKVFNKSGDCIGSVEDIIETGRNPILRVNKTILIPYVSQFIKRVDIDSKEIFIEEIEGLL